MEKIKEMIYLAVVLSVLIGMVGATGTFDGYVYNNAGDCDEGVAGATVYIYNANNDYEVTTDGSCHYSQDVEPGDYTLIGAKEGYYSQEKTRTISDGGTVGVNFLLTAAPGNGNLEGYVKDTSGLPIAGATVHVENTGLTVDTEDTTDENGYYDFPGIPADSYTMDVTMDGYNDGSASEVVVNDGATTTQNFTLTKNGWIYGTVTDDSSNNLAGVNVSVWDGATLVASTLTAADGTYNIPIVEGTYNVTFHLDGYDDDETDDVVVTGDTGTEVNAVLYEQNMIIEGYITDADTSSPIEDATVETSEGCDDTALTDATGYYELSCPAGAYTVYASKDEYYSNQTNVAGIHGETVWANMTLTYYDNGDITGYILDTNSNGIDSATVYLMKWDGSAWNDMDSTTANASGYYEFLNQELGTYKVYAEKEGYNSKESANGTLTTDGQTIELNDTLTKNGIVHGYVTDGANVLENANVTLDGRWTLTDESGYYEFTEVEEGTYDMTANKQFYSGDNATVTVDLANLDVEQNFTLGQEMINVTIHVNGFDGASEYDLDNATVELAGDSGTYSGTTDATGNVTFEIPSGVYDWTASHDGYDTGSKAGIGFYSGNTYDEITLNKHGEIIGTVMSWTDTAIADALVKVYDAGTTTVEGTDITDTSGDYTVGDLSAGNYDVKVLKGGCVPVMKENKNVAIGGTTTVNFKISCQ